MPTQNIKLTTQQSSLHSQPSSLIPQRTLLLMRHAKTESPYTLKRDFDRVLTATGKQDALKMGTWIKSQGLKIDRILSSSAQRTSETTEQVLQALNLDLSQVDFLEELYHASPKTFLEVIQRQADSTETLLIVSHNMGITDFANQLTSARIDHLQPGSVFAVQAVGKKWRDFLEAEGRFLFYQQP